MMKIVGYTALLVFLVSTAIVNIARTPNGANIGLIGAVFCIALGIGLGAWEIVGVLFR